MSGYSDRLEHPFRKKRATNSGFLEHVFPAHSAGDLA